MHSHLKGIETRLSKIGRPDMAEVERLTLAVELIADILLEIEDLESALLSIKAFCELKVELP